MTTPLIDFAPPIARPTVKPSAEASNTKSKQGRPTKKSGANKRAKKS